MNDIKHILLIFASMNMINKIISYHINLCTQYFNICNLLYMYDNILSEDAQQLIHWLLLLLTIMYVNTQVLADIHLVNTVVDSADQEINRFVNSLTIYDHEHMDSKTYLWF